MNFKEAILSTELIIESGEVPLIVGESGIGKTSLVRKLSKDRNSYYIVIDGNMLKEGEIGGLPTIEDYEVVADGQKIRRKKTVYAVHTKLLEIDDVIKRAPDREIILFIDEINRCEHSVQQELMNIILNREINGYKLPSKVKVIAAMNPSNKYDIYSDTDYQVVDMDPAQEDRFVWIELEADVDAWINWGIENNINREVLDFVSSFPQYLNTPDSKDMIKATPRSWERVSKIYNVYLTKAEKVSDKVLFNVIKGNVGAAIADEFLSFLKSSKNPIISPEEIFESEDMEMVKRKVELQSHSRLYMTSKNALLYLENKAERRREVKLFIEFLSYLPKDLRIAMMKEIKASTSSELYEEFLNEESFVNSYFNAVI